MSNNAIQSPAQSEVGRQSVGTAKRRYAIYGIGALIVLLVLAYVDGGEEPLHPIVQSVSLPSQSESSS